MPDFIKFSKCPVGNHNGEAWPKLSRIDTEKPVILATIEYCWSDELTLAWIQEDTFPDWAHEDFEELLDYFYGLSKVFGLAMTFEQGDTKITTFRIYNPKTIQYWSRRVGRNLFVKGG